MKVGFFYEKEGVKSAVRLQMFLTLIFSFLVIGYQVYIRPDHDFEFLNGLLLLTASFTPKVIQKFAELRQG